MQSAKPSPWPWVAGLLLLASYQALFGPLLPNASGRVGHDYAFFLPSLLDGFFWYSVNGAGPMPWFTPAFCGGSMAAINLNTGYLTVPQALTVLMDPLAAVRSTFLLFAALGFVGAYLMLRRGFHLSRSISTLGAGIILFNGFYASRMLSGHLHYHGFMLLPWVIGSLVRPLAQAGRARWSQIAFDSVVAGALLAYLLHSGFSSLMPPALLAILAAGLLGGLVHGGHRDFLLRLGGAGVVSLSVSASKLVAMSSLLDAFPRDAYPLPGAGSFGQAAWLALRSLALSPAFDPDRGSALVNLAFNLDRHELEYDVTPLPFLLLAFAALVALRRVGGARRWPGWTYQRWLAAAGLAALLILPVALDTHGPEWTPFLKRLPLVASSSNLVRWTLAYIPFIVIAAALALDRTVSTPRRRAVIAVAGLVLVVALNAVTERGFYARQDYDPGPVNAAYREVVTGRLEPRITRIEVYLNQDGAVALPQFRNDSLTRGASQLLCYEPMFGYRLEAFPIRSLRPGPALEERDGVLNVKNPACYVWPEANDCVPGDHFLGSQRSGAESFLAYRPFPYRVSTAQRIADVVSRVALILVLLVLGARAASRILARLRPGRLI